MVDRFKQLRTLASPGFKEYVQSGWHGENHFCILDENSREMLSVTLDDAGKYIVTCQEYSKTHQLAPDKEQGMECPEHAEGESGTLRAEHTVATTAPQTAQIWSAWERDAPPREAADRDRLVNNLRYIQKHYKDTLLLYHLNISSLPERLPPCISNIQICHVPLTCLPSFPPGMRILSIDSTPLTSQPALPDGLEWMNISDTLLTELPELPGGLEKLFINIPSLTRLPEVPDGLSILQVNNTSITSLPESFTSLSPSTFVDISNNPLSEYAHNTLAAMTRAPGYSGPKIHFGMAGDVTTREARPLHLAVADWLTPENEGEPAPQGGWQSFGQEKNAASFSAFLDRLSGTENFKKDPDFKAQTALWLTELAKDRELRANTFAMATEATSRCEDRVTIALHDMKNVQLVHNAENGKYDNKLPELVTAGREMFRLDKLAQIARNKASKLTFVDEIEVYLGYQNKLKEALELSRVTNKMRYFGVSHITESDLEAAKLEVKTAENDQFGEWILQWGPLRIILERVHEADWKALVEKKESDYGDAYRTLSDAELKSRGQVGDDDAERAIGARALESAEQAFLDGLRPLADRMLGEYLEARW